MTQDAQPPARETRDRDSGVPAPKESRDAQDALAVYLEMGEERSLRGLVVELQQRYSGTGRKAPAERTIMGWSAAFGWQQRAIQHDQVVAERMRKAAIKREARERDKRHDRRLDRAHHLNDMVDRILFTDEERDENGQTVRVRVLRDPHAIGPAMLKVAVVLSQEARAIEREDLGIAPLAEETSVDQQPIRTREEMLLIYQRIDQGVAYLQRKYGVDGDTIQEVNPEAWAKVRAEIAEKVGGGNLIEGEATEVAGAWDTEDPDLALWDTEEADLEAWGT